MHQNGLWWHQFRHCVSNNITYIFFLSWHTLLVVRWWEGGARLRGGENSRHGPHTCTHALQTTMLDASLTNTHIQWKLVIPTQAHNTMFTHRHMNTYTHTYTSTLCLCEYMCVNVCISASKWVRQYVCVRMYVCTYVCLYVCVSTYATYISLSVWECKAVSVRVCVFVWGYTILHTSVPVGPLGISVM